MFKHLTFPHPYNVGRIEKVVEAQLHKAKRRILSVLVGCIVLTYVYMRKDIYGNANLRYAGLIVICLCTVWLAVLLIASLNTIRMHIPSDEFLDLCKYELENKKWWNDLIKTERRTVCDLHPILPIHTFIKHLNQTNGSLGGFPDMVTLEDRSKYMPHKFDPKHVRCYKGPTGVRFPNCTRTITLEDMVKSELGDDLIIYHPDFTITDPENQQLVFPDQKTAA